jgi:hypothetical protein
MRAIERRGRGHDFCEGPAAPHRAHSDVAFLVRRQEPAWPSDGSVQQQRQATWPSSAVGITRPLLVAAAMQLKLSAGVNISLLRLYASEE